MAYFIFTKDSENSTGTIHRIAENEFDLNNLTIDKNNYTIIQDNAVNFEDIKLNKKHIDKYNNNSIVYVVNGEPSFSNSTDLINYINKLKLNIKYFTDNNSNHPLFNRWSNYYNQLNNLNVESITYPLNKSLEQYFNDLGQPSYHILQLP
jgi:hypothetical protein